MKSIPSSMQETADLSIDDLKALDSEAFENNCNAIDICKFTAHLRKTYRNVATILCNLYLLAVTVRFRKFDCLFFSLTAVDSPQRRSMTGHRETDLTYLLPEPWPTVDTTGYVAL